MFRTHVRFVGRVFGKFLFRLIDQFYAVAVIHSRSLLRRTSDYYKLREKRRKKIFAILSDIYIYILYVYKYIYTHDTVKRPHVSPRVPLRIIKPCICHRSEPVSVPRNRNRCLTHSSTRFDKRIGLRPKESFSNPSTNNIDSNSYYIAFYPRKNSFSKRLAVFTFLRNVSAGYTALHRSSSSSSSCLSAIRVHLRLRPSELSRERGRDDKLCQYNCPRVSQIRG